jgi:Xaa-Pro dipeptidase
MQQVRLDRLSLALRSEGLDAIALNPGPSLYYLTGLSFHLMERPVIALFTPHAPPHLVLPQLERSKAEAADKGMALFPYEEDEASRDRALAEAVTRLDLRRGRIAVEPLRCRVLELRMLEAAAPEATFASASAALAPLRLSKDAAEAGLMRQAVAVAERALDATLPLLRMGMTESELAAELTLQMLRAGSDSELPFPAIVASGPNSALPHAVPGTRRLQSGDLLILDWGAAVSGYVSDLTRTFAIHKVPGGFQQIHETVLRANAAGRQAARPGIACGAVDQAARSVIDHAGYGEHFIHRTGHGIGLEPHEPPFIRQDEEQQLAPGMTFTVEPGIYLPGRGGVRVEDDVLITPDGCETLTHTPRELKVIL